MPEFTKHTPDLFLVAALKAIGIEYDEVLTVEGRYKKAIMRYSHSEKIPTVQDFKIVLRDSKGAKEITLEEYSIIFKEEKTKIFKELDNGEPKDE